MSRKKFHTIGLLAASLALALPANAQTAAQVARSAHLIVIKMIDIPGSKVPYAFDPATFTAERGDTLEFVQFANTMHNVHFKAEPKGVHLGTAELGPYLTTKGEKYNLVVDKRFADGKYEIVCDPHELVGMHAFLTVHGSVAPR